MGRALLLAIASFVLPGFGQAAVGRRRAAIIWAALVPLATLGVLAWVWLFFVAFALRVGSAIHAGAATRRASTFDWMAPLPMIVAGVAVVTFTGLRYGVIEGFKTPTSSMYPTLQIGDHVFVDKLSPRWRAIERGEVIVLEFPCNSKIDYIKRVVALGGDSVEVRCGVLYVNGKAVPQTPVPGNCSYQDYDEHDDRWFDRTCARYHEDQNGHGYDIYRAPERDTKDRDGGDPRDFPQVERRILPSCRTQYSDDASVAFASPVGKLVDTPSPTACAPQVHYVVPDGMAFVLGDNRDNSNDSRYWGPVAIDKVKGRVFAIWLGGSPSGVDWSRVGSLR